MYKKILVALENTRADDTLVPHIAELARRLGSELLLVHVADGWAARNFDQLKLAESTEMKEDRVYLDGVAARDGVLGARRRPRAACDRSGDGADQEERRAPREGRPRAARVDAVRVRWAVRRAQQVAQLVVSERTGHGESSG